MAAGEEAATKGQLPPRSFASSLRTPPLQLRALARSRMPRASRIRAWIRRLLRHYGRRRCRRRDTRTRQAHVLELLPSVELLRLEPHFVCAYPVGNHRITAIANNRYFDH